MIESNACARSEPIEIDEIEFHETPTDLVLEAVREYEALQAELILDENYSADSNWVVLAHLVVGHEIVRFGKISV